VANNATQVSSTSRIRDFTCFLSRIVLRNLAFKIGEINMSDLCFWILKNGIIVKVESRHILAVVSFPEVFGETRETIKEIFEKQNQSPNSNYEGIAREEVLARVISRNNIRIRKNQHKRDQHWSLQLHSLTDERIFAIAAWANYISTNANDKHADVVIHQFKDGSKIKTSLDKLALENLKAINPEIINQAELSDFQMCLYKMEQAEAEPGQRRPAAFEVECTA
jgi:hypothetical protein